MKTWKLVSGILSIVLSVFVIIQSGAAGLANALEKNGEVGGSAGLIVAIALLVGGIVSIVTRNGGIGGAVALFVIFGLAALVGFVCAGSYKDLTIWSGWCAICMVMSIISIFSKQKGSKKKL